MSISVHKKVRGIYEVSRHEDIDDALSECIALLTNKSASPQSIEEGGKILYDQEALFSLWVDRQYDSA